MIGTEMKVRDTADMPAVFHGMRVKVLRQSGRTGGLTVEVLETRGCYRIGDKLHMNPYNVEPVEPRLTAMQTFYGTPTPANAIRLAIADHAAHCSPMAPQSEYVRELNRALDRVEAYPELVAHVVALEDHLKRGAPATEGHSLREQQRALLAKLGAT